MKTELETTNKERDYYRNKVLSLEEEKINSILRKQSQDLVEK